MTEAPGRSFVDRLAALVEERSSQVCVGLDPDPEATGAAFPDAAGEGPAERAADSVVSWCRSVIDAAGPACVAVKPQLACFERLGPPGWAALKAVIETSHAAGLLVVADGKRGDVPVSAAAYAQGLLGETPTPFGAVRGLGADAATLNGTLGGDSLEPLIETAAGVGAGLFVLVRTSNSGASDLLDLETAEGPLHEALAAFVAARADRLRGSSGLSGMGAVVGATQPEHLGRLRSLMPDAVFLLPGVGAQGGDPGELAAAFGQHPASALVTASRSVAGAPDPGAAAEALRARVWEVACRTAERG